MTFEGTSFIHSFIPTFFPQYHNHYYYHYYHAIIIIVIIVTIIVIIIILLVIVNLSPILWKCIRSTRGSISSDDLRPPKNLCPYSYLMIMAIFSLGLYVCFRVYATLFAYIIFVWLFKLSIRIEL